MGNSALELLLRHQFFQNIERKCALTSSYMRVVYNVIPNNMTSHKYVSHGLANI